MKPLILIASMLASAPAAGQQFGPAPDARAAVPYQLSTEQPVYTTDASQWEVMHPDPRFVGAWACDQVAPDWTGVTFYMADHQMPSVCHKQP